MSECDKRTFQQTSKWHPHFDSSNNKVINPNKIKRPSSFGRSISLIIGHNQKTCGQDSMSDLTTMRHLLVQDVVWVMTHSRFHKKRGIDTIQQEVRGVIYRNYIINTIQQEVGSIIYGNLIINHTYRRQ